MITHNFLLLFIIIVILLLSQSRKDRDKSSYNFDNNKNNEIIIAASGWLTEPGIMVKASQCPLGGPRDFIYNYTYLSKYGNTKSSNGRGYVAALPPIVYIKAAKTGSSTISNILHRMADVRDLTVMLPKDNIYLGWPGKFPGNTAFVYGRNSVDLICNHAVFNFHVMENYMRKVRAVENINSRKLSSNHGSKSSISDTFYLTSIREPYSHQLSAYNFFINETINKNISWTDHVQRLRNITTVVAAPEVYFRNPIAMNLGWYERNEGSTHNDYNNNEINSFISYIDQVFNLIILLEDIDKGLVLLSHYLGISINEVAYIKMKSTFDIFHIELIVPDNETLVMEEIRSINYVDTLIYDYFSNKFKQLWLYENRKIATLQLETFPSSSGSSSSVLFLEERLSLLQTINKDLDSDCKIKANIVASKQNNSETNTGNITMGNSSIGNNITMGNSSIGNNISMGNSSIGNNISMGNSSIGNNISMGNSRIGNNITMGNSSIGNNISMGNSSSSSNKKSNNKDSNSTTTSTTTTTNSNKGNNNTSNNTSIDRELLVSKKDNRYNRQRSRLESGRRCHPAFSRDNIRYTNYLHYKFDKAITDRNRCKDVFITRYND